MKSDDIQITWKNSLSTLDIVKKSMDLSSEQIRYYRQNQKIYEQFEVSLNNHHWTILKDNEELEDFLKHLEKKFCPSDSDKKKKKFIVQNAPVPRILSLLRVETFDFEDQKITEFFEIFDLQFNKVKSLQLNKKCGGRYVDKICTCSCFQWKQRKFVITSNGILYHKQKSGQKKIGEYISFNKYFSYEFGIETGYEFGIRIKSYHRRLLLKANSFKNFIEVIHYLEKAFQAYNDGRHHNLYNAFSAPKNGNNVQFLVDGKQYFASVAQQISKAKHQVMIAGWWISPEFYLIRPIDPQNPEKNRFSTILKQIIKKNNVKIYILAYRQSPMFLPNDSKYTKQALESISPNIKVITHPINVIPSLWSHHQKIVVVDQKVAFLGGLDLCYGRYDSSDHSITDKENLYPGIEFNNSRIKDFSKVRQYEISNIMRSKHPRLPWHDVAIKIIGPSVSDVSKHFIEYWNFASYESLYQERIVLVPQSIKISNKIKQVVTGLKKKIFNSSETSDEKVQQQKKKRPQMKQNVQTNHTIKGMIGEQIQQTMQSKQKHQNQLNNFTQIVEQSGQNQVYRYADSQQANRTQKKQATTDQTFHKKVRKPSLPQNIKKLSIRKNIKKLFVPNQKDQEQYYDSDNGEYLNERSYDFQQEHENVINNRRSWKEWIMKKAESYDQKKIRRSKQERDIKSQDRSALESLIMTKEDRCQILRSVAKWSIGCKQNQSESSIHEAYIDMIRNAQHFIFIENQFFMSAIDGEKVLKNLVAKTLIQRITKAIKQRQKFRVLVFMPLIPGFAGQLDQPDAILPRVIMHWEYTTIWSGQNSIIKSIQKLTPDPSKYIQFYGLRTHGLVNNEPKTEIVYLHSKLMIVDDKKLIIGSANINDRSMRGTRDSQICAQVSGGRLIDSIVNGQSFKVNQKIRDLRVKLLKQHLGRNELNENSLDLIDILNSQTFQHIQNVAKVNFCLNKQNTEAYRQLFGCYPDNQIDTLKNLHKSKRMPTKQQYVKLSKRIQGHIVHFPYKFLSKENLLEGNSIYPNGIST